MTERLQFDAVWRLLHRPRSEIGPVPALDDHRMVCGALFARWNDGSVRALHAHRGEPPLVEAYWVRDFSGVVHHARVFVTSRCAEVLVGERLVERCNRDVDGEYRLSQRGMVHVARDWFDAELLDCMKAGARIGDGPAWPI